MFFAPPKVKSLSKYSEFGSHLDSHEFPMMLGFAVLIHLCIVAIYYMTPHQQVVHIPVRVMNIKLSGGDGSISMADMPQVAGPEQKPASSPQASVMTNSNTATTIIDETPSKPGKHSNSRFKIYRQKNTPSVKTIPHTNLDEAIQETPKQYVRASDADANKPSGSTGGPKTADSKEGQEMIQRYEQTISLWMENHKTYPEAARKLNMEGSAIVRVRIDRQGHIIYKEIDKSSGNAMIDDAALAMVTASDPVPAVPDDYPDGSQVEFLIPVSFTLQ